MTRLIRLFCALGLAVAAFVAAPMDGPDGLSLHGPSAQAADNTVQTRYFPSLRQRRQASRDATVRQAETRCRAVSREVSAFENRPCAAGDYLDTARNICVPRKHVWKPYSRWDPAAGRCKPRDTFDGASCIGNRQMRYNPDKQNAQSLAKSLSMYGRAGTRMAARLNNCEQTASELRHQASDARMRNARQCGQARKLGRVDLIKIFCN